MEWKLIETAPKDGARILLRGKSGRHSDGFWESKAYNGNGCWVWPYIHANPTHWMPLPDPPVDAAPATLEGTMLCNLLARIHGDGGHYIEQHGLEKAVEDAELLVARWRAELKPVEDPESLELRSNARLWMFVEKNPWRAADILRDGCSTNPVFWGDEARAAIDLAAWEEL